MTNTPDHELRTSIDSPLHHAALTGNHDEIRRLVTRGADVNAAVDIEKHPEWHGFLATPLMVAAGSNLGASVETLDLLLELGADPKLIPTAVSVTELASAGLRGPFGPGGDAARLKRLLDAGSPFPDDPGEANDLLCDTAATGDVARVQLLLDRGVNPRGFFDPVRALARHHEMQRWLAKHRAGMPDLYASLPAEARASIAESEAVSERERAARAVAAPSSSEIPLFRAAASGSAECVRYLLDAGADPLARDNDRETAMYAAASEPVVRMLIAAGVPIDDTNELGWTPLRAALCLGESTLPRVRALIAAGADVNAPDDDGYTVLMFAVGTGRYPEMLRLLIAAGADPHAVTKHGSNAFHAAIDVNGAESNTVESIRDTFGYLKELGVDIERRTEDGWTPLACAIAQGGGFEVTVLCELGADPNALCGARRWRGNESGDAELPLLFHAVNCAVDSEIKTEALLRAGADPLAADSGGHTALVHKVGALCYDAPDCEASFDQFFTGLNELRFATPQRPMDRDGFIAAAMPIMRDYTERFAAGIPLKIDPRYPDYAHKDRAAAMACIAHLAAYEAWAEFERSPG